jgi:hypothetical protein
LDRCGPWGAQFRDMQAMAPIPQLRVIDLQPHGGLPTCPHPMSLSCLASYPCTQNRNSVGDPTLRFSCMSHVDLWRSPLCGLAGSSMSLYAAQKCFYRDRVGIDYSKPGKNITTLSQDRGSDTQKQIPFGMADLLHANPPFDSLSITKKWLACTLADFTDSARLSISILAGITIGSTLIYHHARRSNVLRLLSAIFSCLRLLRVCLAHVSGTTRS